MEAEPQVMSPLAERIQKVSVSLTLKIVERAKHLKAQGKDVISLSVGEPDHPTPANIKEAGVKAIEKDFTRYTAPAGTVELREVICEKLRKDNGLDYSPKQIVVANGAKHSISNAILALVNPGDEVVIPEPCWLSYPDMVHLAGGEPIYAKAKLEDGFHLRPEALRAAISPRTKAVILNTPCNPTGAILSREDVEGLCDVLRESDAYLISDEIYEHLRFDGREHFSPAAMPGMKERTVLVNGASKCYSMTGWRIGYSASTEEIAEGLLRIQSQMTSSACSISQKAALEGLAGDQRPVELMREDFSRRRKLVFELLQQCDGIEVTEPEGAFYIFPDVSSFFGKRFGDTVMRDSIDLAEYIISTCYVTVVPGAVFRAPNCIRISYANSDENVREGVTRICDALLNLQD